MKACTVVALLCALTALAAADLIDPPRTFNPLTEQGMSVDFTVDTNGKVNCIVIYYSGAVHIGDFYKDSATALKTGVAVGQKCDKYGITYEYFSGTDARTTLDSIVDPDPPNLATPLLGPSTTQYSGCKVPGMVNDVGYPGFPSGVTWKDFVMGPTVFEDSTCSGNVAAQIFIRNGSTIASINVLGKTFTNLGYPFTHLNTAIACTVFSSDARLYWQLPKNTSSYALQKHMQAFGTIPVPGKVHTKWNWFAITFTAFTGVLIVVQLIVAAFGPLKRTAKTNND